MSDLADVENAMVAQIASVLFPAPYLPGAYAASNVAWITAPATVAAAGVCRLYRGWPESWNLDGDLAVGKAHVSVFPEQGMARLSTRYGIEWFVPTPAVPTLTVSTSGSVVTFGGTGGAGQVAAVQFGDATTPSAYAYRLTATDSPASVAAALAALIAGATVNGAALTVPSVLNVRGIVVADTAALRELRRQEQMVRVSIWAPTPAARDALVAAVDMAFAGMVDAYGNPTEFITMPAGDAARVLYRGRFTDDRPSKDRLWRVDLRYAAEYGTTAVQVAPLMLFGTVTETLTVLQ